MAIDNEPKSRIQEHGEVSQKDQFDSSKHASEDKENDIGGPDFAPEIITAEDLDQIWTWNTTVPATVNKYIDEIIEERAFASPGAPAICAWDGDLTYGELNDFATRLASRLIQVGVTDGKVVPLCFEKSKWAIVGALGVLKAGGAFLLLDPSVPEQRNRSSVEKVGADLMLAGSSTATVGTRLLKTVIHLNQGFIDSISHFPKLPPITRSEPSSAIMYAVTTSGSTGIPKCATISHSSFCSAFKYQAQLLGFHDNSRVFNFASYAFDISIHDIFTALASGGCLCVPSEEDRRDRVAETMASMRATITNVTPTVSRLLDPALLPDLKTLILVGEAVSAEDAARWLGKSVFINGYGPCECTPVATINRHATDAEEATSIGRGAGVITWVVDPQDQNLLVPPGNTGELVLEGPIVGMGYLNDRERTEEAFVDSPLWLLQGARNFPGRQGRVYKTGDLVRYRGDGSLRFVGRKDAQVKIRGQRVELEEVESKVQQCTSNTTQVVAEVIIPKGQNSRPTLVAFVLEKTKPAEDHGTSEPRILEIPEASANELANLLPSYMVPSVFFTVKRLPLTSTGKTDRKALREMGSTLSTQQLAEAHTTARGPKRQPQTDIEIQMQQLWSQILGVDRSIIGLEDSFLKLGGDSFSAMKLVAIAHQAGLSLSVADILQNPTLYHVSSRCNYLKSDIATEISPFSLVGEGVNARSVLDAISSEHQIDNRTIQDAYPCTPLQEGIVSLSVKHPGDYIQQAILELSPAINIKTFRAAWEEVVKSMPILRTTFLLVPHLSLLQVVLDAQITWLEAASLDKYLEKDKKQAMDVRNPFARYGLIVDSTGKYTQFVWTVHHALYDGWSLPLITKAVEEAYTGRMQKPQASFQAFIKYTHGQDEGKAADYWKTVLEKCESVPFPNPPVSSEEKIVAHSIVEHRMPITSPSSTNVTSSTLIQAAWGIVAGNITNCEDVVFGITVSGRNAPVAGIDEITGPTIATLPFRVRLAKVQTISDYIGIVQQQVVDSIAFEQTGLQRISKFSSDCSRACMFQTLISIQPRRQPDQHVLGTWHEEDLGQWFKTYGLVIEVQLGASTMLVRASYSHEVLEPQLVNQLLFRLESVLHQLSHPGTKKRLSDIQIMTSHDLNQIWDWNHAVPARIEQCVHEMIERNIISQPDAPAICAWDGNLTYRELGDLSTRLASKLLQLDARIGDIIPICFPKSMWSIVSMLAVMKAGGAFVLFDPALPEGRLENMFTQVNGNLILSSSSSVDMSRRICSRCVGVDWELFASLGNDQTLELPKVPPQSLACIVFTSGTTGTPKGSLLTHQSHASALHHQRGNFTSDSRVWDFAAQSFDVSIYGAFNAMESGGCLCIPNEEDRRNNPAKSIRELRANHSFFTPTVAQLISPQDVPGLKMIMFCGEILQVHHLVPWWKKVDIINIYGPSECTPVSALSRSAPTLGEATRIGKGAGQVTWIVNPENHDLLVPPGCVGELLLEGPQIGPGYIGNPEATASAYAEDPLWLLQGTPNHPGRRGRLYKTGDLVRYNSDGSLTMLGRKDSQVKIRGQRVELAEVEHQLQQCLPGVAQLAAEVITPDSDETARTLVAFLQTNRKQAVINNSNPEGVELVPVPADVVDRLAKQLPSYMIPTAFFNISQIPLASTAKTNRKMLREIGASFSKQRLAEMQTGTLVHKRAPATLVERQMQNVWAKVLRIDAKTIGLDDSFFQLGGDSISAMRVVAEAQKMRMNLKVADIFRHRRLHAVAGQVEAPVNGLEEPIVPFSLLPDKEVSSLLQSLSTSYQLDPSAIADAYPCLPLQEGLVSLSLRRQGDYIMQTILDLSVDINIKRFRKAWEETFQAIPILRTRFCQAEDGGLVQVIVKQQIEWREVTSLDNYLLEDQRCFMDLGMPLTRFALIQDNTGRYTQFVWTIHHGIYDEWSILLVIQAVNNLYKGRPLQPKPQFQKFIKYVNMQDQKILSDYWENLLSHCESVPFPGLPSSMKQPAADSVLEQPLPNFSVTSVDITAPTLLKAALALIIGETAGTQDVTFGVTVAGRNAPVTGIDQITGPTIATVPFRVQLNKQDKISTYLNAIQQLTTGMIPYEQTGLQRIAKMSPDCQQACEFQTLLVIQPDRKQEDDDGAPGHWRPMNADLHRFNSYGLLIEVRLGTDGNSAKASFDSQIIDQWVIQKLLDRFGFALEQLSSFSEERTLREVNIVTSQDLGEIWAWNEKVPQPADTCVLDIIRERIAVQPKAVAICAWDGELTYEELDESSTRIANHLIDIGVRPGWFIPLCFEKSKWTTVAMLGVMKSRSSFVLLDPYLPMQRLKHIVDGVDTQLILSSPSSFSISSELSHKVIVVDDTLLSELQTMPLATLVSPTLDSIYCAVYTSGTTGIPKGTAISHRNAASAVQHQSNAWAFTPQTRLYDFSSYSFDGPPFHMLHVLAAGGCLCVPSDEGRKNDLGRSMESLHANTVVLTPSVSRLLSPDEVPSLKYINLTGETITTKDIQPWWGRVSTSYSPSECTTAALFTPHPSNPEDTIRLGKGYGVNTWVVDQEDHHILVPPGCVGELLLEGPLVGLGYIGEPNMTAAAFIESPDWLLRGSANVQGRNGRLYKTGDLVRYSPDGGLSFVGRKDTQVKINGQRVELSEIEYHLLENMPKLAQVAVDTITPRGENSGSVIAAFLQFETDATQSADPEGSVAEIAEMASIPADVINKLSRSLPRYMIPKAFFTLPTLPLSITGKMDRKRLRQIGASFSKQKLTEMQSVASEPKKIPITKVESQIQSIWAHVLKIELTRIGLDDGFFELGGDSIAAMKAVGKARQEGLNISVGDIFNCRTLCDLAYTALPSKTADTEPVDPFSLLMADANISELIEELSSQCQTSSASIQDAYPCTPLQEGLLSLTLKRAGAYVMQATLELSPDIHEHVFRQAWEEVTQQMPILRTRIVPHKNLGLLQVVVKENIHWVETTALKGYLEEDRAVPMTIGQPLSRYALVRSKTDTKRYFVWTMHHALYDGWSMSLLLDAVRAVYQKQAIKKGPQFQTFIKYAQAQRDDLSAEFWHKYLDGYDSVLFPELPASVTEPRANASLEHIFAQPQSRHLGATTSTLIRAAWGLVVGRMTSSRDVVFGVTSFGRNAPIANIQDMVAPAIATMPVRVRLPMDQSVVEYAKSLQREAAGMIPFENTGLTRIAKVSPDCQQACMFQSLLVIQPQTQNTNSDEDLLGKWDFGNQTQWFNTYALMLEIALGTDQIAVTASFDSRVIEPWVVRKVLGCLESVMQQLDCATPQQVLGDIDTLTPQNLDQIWEWNATAPEPVHRLVHEMVSERVEDDPDALAIDAWDGQMTYGEIDQLATRFSHQLVELGVKPEVLIPLCFEKSMWTSVAMFAVLKAGGAFVLLDTSLPEQRLRSVVEQAEPPFIISSVAKYELGSSLFEKAIRLGPEIKTRSDPATPLAPQIPSPTSAMFAVFTSGSTGVPKGIILTHSSFASGVTYQSEALGITKDTRIYDFPAYAFDIAVHDVFATLANGACLCVPSDKDRQENISKAMKEMRATWVDTTPTVGRLMDPTSLPDLKILIIGGEPVTEEDVARWGGGSTQVVNAYGPAECLISTFKFCIPGDAENIGKGVGLMTWVVDPNDHEILLPPGCVGELLLEGPLVGRGYLNSPEKTAASFIEEPKWLMKGAPGRPGRHGRFYKTGDLVRYNEDGSLVFIGRKDIQVKIRGQRVELGEIERRMQDAMPDALEVIAETITPQSENPVASLATFVVAPGTASDESSTKLQVLPIPSDIQAKLAEHLPLYMIPPVMFTMSEIPLTPTGKINRKRLREIGASFSAQELSNLESADYGTKRQPTSEMERRLQSIWSQVLRVDIPKIGLDDNFFHLGGDSVAAMKVVGEARSLGFEISVADMFRRPRLEDMTQTMSVDRSRSGNIPALGICGPIQQSFAQRRLWFLEQLHPGLSWYHVSWAVHIGGPMDVAALEIALLALESRHDSLRTTFTSQNSIDIQIIHPFKPNSLRVVPLIGLSDQQIRQAVEEEQATSFKLESEPGWRVALFQLAKSGHILSIVMHHIISDGWSIDILQKDLSALYSAALRNQNPLLVLDPLPIQYSDYSEWQRQKVQVEEQQRQLDYWIEQLETSQPAEIICDKPRPATLSGRANAQTVKIEGPLYERLLQFCKSQGATVFAVLLAAFRATHFRLTGKTDANIGTANANRDRWQLKNIIGFFVNVQCLRIKIEQESFEQLVKQVHQTSIESFENQEVPFDKVVSELRRDRDMSRHPLFQIAFAVHSQMGLGQLKLEGLKTESLDYSVNTRFDLEFHFFQEANGLNGEVLFSTDLYEPGTISNMIALFHKVLEQVLLYPKMEIAKLPLLSDESYLEMHNKGLLDIHETGYARESSIIDVFRQQVHSYPERVAVTDSSSRLTYAELDLQSDLIARWLNKQSLKNEALVSVLAPRSSETIIAFLGILKAHLAYLPLDTKIPAGRMQTILSSLPGEKFVLTGKTVKAPSLLLDDVNFFSISSILNEQNQEALSAQLLTILPSPSATSLAYVMFTSGSTGQPKGVMIEHRGVIRLATKNDLLEDPRSTASWAHMANIAFDLSTLEIYAPLLNGGTLVCIDHTDLLDYDGLARTFADKTIGSAIFTPALLKQFLLESPTVISQLDTLYIGGDRADPQDISAARKLVKGDIFNCYGPTENTGASTIYRYEDWEACISGVPIGRAINNSGAYIMDSNLQLVPMGVVGELVVTGDGLARGYTDPEQDIDRFVTISLGGKKTRAYRTGDYARYRPNNNQLDFFGRIDGQVKLRGYRIEIAEIEHVLRSDPLVTNAIIVLHSTEENQQLAGFVTAQWSDTSITANSDDSTNIEQDAAQVEMWRGLADGDTYSALQNVHPETIGRDFVGWTSIYDGRVIPKTDMEEWLDDTIATILSSGHPNNILEVGTGSGMILFNLANIFQSYAGLEPSTKAASFVSKAVKTMPTISEKVQLYNATATDVSQIRPKQSPDFVILNSVAQYFPSQEYLSRVIEDLLKLKEVKTIFFGDIRSHTLYRQFLIARVLHKVGDKPNKDEIRQKITEMETTEPELLIDPGFFTNLPSRFPQLVEHVEILPKRMKATNDLSAYRYAAVVHIKTARSSRHIIDVKQGQWVDFMQHGLDRDSLMSLLRDHSSSAMVAVSNIPHQKSILERTILNSLENESESPSAAEWLPRLRQDSKKSPALSAIDLSELAESTGFRLELSWARQHSQRGGLDAVFHRHESLDPPGRVLFKFPTDHEGRPYYSLSNHPLRHQERHRLQDRLQKKLEAQLPPYMIPQSLMVLDTLPLNDNGKVDHKALIERVQIKKGDIKSTRKPISKTQRQMQTVWAQVLNFEAETIGLDDNFFGLGGNSITAMKVVGEARKLGAKLVVADVFHSNTLEELAGCLQVSDTAEIETMLDQAVLIDPPKKTNLIAKIDSLGIDISSQEVLDIFPVTSHQHKSVADGVTRGQLCNYFHLKLGHSLDISRFRDAWVSTLERFPLLRARFLFLDESYWQVVPREVDLALEILDVSGDLAKLEDDLCMKHAKGLLPTQPPFGIILLRHPTQGFQMTLHISHAQYDGISFPTMMQSFTDAYEGRPLAAVRDYSRFLSYSSYRRPNFIKYWSKLLRGSYPTTFPSELLPDGTPKPTRPEPVVASGVIGLPPLPNHITTATLFSAAWGVLLSLLTGKNDIVYGHIVNGRNSTLAGIEEIVGSCLNVIPARLILSPHQTKDGLLSLVQKQFLEVGEADSLGYKDIAQHCTNWPGGADFEFNNIILHQDVDEHPEAGFTNVKSKVQWFDNHHLPFPNLMIQSQPEGEGLRISVLANTDLITMNMARKLPDILGGILWDLGTELDLPLPTQLTGIN